MTDAHEDSNAELGFTFSGYDRGHPWHYLQRGDGAAPVTPDQIPVAAVEIAGGYLDRQIPKAPDKRDAAVERLFAERSEELADRIARYEDVVARGVEALSRYDREIAYGGDLELAVACSLAMLYCQISYVRAEVAWLDSQRSGQGSLF